MIWTPEIERPRLMLSQHRPLSRWLRMKWPPGWGWGWGSCSKCCNSAPSSPIGPCCGVRGQDLHLTASNTGATCLGITGTVPAIYDASTQTWSGNFVTTVAPIGTLTFIIHCSTASNTVCYPKALWQLSWLAGCINNALTSCDDGTIQGFNPGGLNSFSLQCSPLNVLFHYQISGCTQCPNLTMTDFTLTL